VPQGEGTSELFTPAKPECTAPWPVVCRERVIKLVEHEARLIAELQYEPFFP
jgi:hypothetical protein